MRSRKGEKGKEGKLKVERLRSERAGGGTRRKKRQRHGRRKRRRGKKGMRERRREGMRRHRHLKGRVGV